jgi:hypothetical protein
MEDYKEWLYSDLKAECAKRELGGKGSKDDLIDKLVADDLRITGSGLKPTDPNPENPNWDMAGRWIRR